MFDMYLSPKLCSRHAEICTLLHSLVNSSGLFSSLKCMCKYLSLFSIPSTGAMGGIIPKTRRTTSASAFAQQCVGTSGVGGQLSQHLKTCFICD